MTLSQYLLFPLSFYLLYHRGLISTSPDVTLLYRSGNMVKTSQWPISVGFFSHRSWFLGSTCTSKLSTSDSGLVWRTSIRCSFRKELLHRLVVERHGQCQRYVGQRYVESPCWKGPKITCKEGFFLNLHRSITLFDVRGRNPGLRCDLGNGEKRW